MKKKRIFFILAFVRWVFGYCPAHGWFQYPRRYRMNTAYVEDKANYAVGCKHCQKESDEYYQELWDEYYKSLF